MVISHSLSRMTKAKTHHLTSMTRIFSSKPKTSFPKISTTTNPRISSSCLLGRGEGETSPPRGKATEGKGGGKEASDQGGILEEASGSKSIPKTQPMPVHDPAKLPSGKPCPPGFNWDGVRLVRNTRGSKKGLLTLPPSFGICIPLNSANKT